MKYYVVTFRGKTYRYRGESCLEVAEKFGNRKVFGSPLVFSLRLRQYDAGTMGEQWAVYDADGERVEIDAVDD